MERWVPISMVVFTGLAVVIVVVFTTIYSKEARDDPSRGPRLAVLLVPPPPPPRRYPSNRTDGAERAETAKAANASLLAPAADLANSAAVFPVDSSSPEAFLLRHEHGGLGGHREHRPPGRPSSRPGGPGLQPAVMDAPGGPPESAGSGKGTAPPGPPTAVLGHKVLRGDRRMFSGEVSIPSPSDRLQRVVLAKATATAATRPRPAFGTRITTPGHTLMTTRSTTRTTPQRPDHADTRAVLEEALREVRPVNTAIIRKAMQALIQAYERHVQLEKEASSPESRPRTSRLPHNATIPPSSAPPSRSSPRPPSTTTPRPTSWSSKSTFWITRKPSPRLPSKSTFWVTPRTSPPPPSRSTFWITRKHTPPPLTQSTFWITRKRSPTSANLSLKGRAISKKRALWKEESRKTRKSVHLDKRGDRTLFPDSINALEHL